MEIFSTAVLIADGLLTIFGLAALFIKPIRERITKSKERDDHMRQNFETLKSDMEQIKSRQKISEKDELRTQLLLLIADYPHEISEIMKLAEHYFKDINGNWYLTSLFNKWLEDNDLAKPEWFKV